MINTPLLTVVGHLDVDDDVIFCSRLVFVGLNPRLVIKPKKNSTPGAQRILKIVADTIDTQASTSPEITYSLATESEYKSIIPGTPKVFIPIIESSINDNGLDPKTQATPGADGEPNFSHGTPPLIPPDTASPNFLPIIDIGAFPKAKSGGNGMPGGRGKDGEKGSNAPILEIWTREIVGPQLILDLRGQQGGDGGAGGNGQFGGTGQQGSAGVVGADSNWLGVPTPICVQQPGLGGDGGNGGDGGCGGNGGDGGNGGFIKIFYTGGVNLGNFNPLYSKGKGGKAGPPGIPGKGGKAGPPGINLAECPQALGSPDGQDGSRCYMGNSDLPGLAVDGQDGEDGYYLTQQVANIPDI
jgi:hypothetical protein